MDHDDSATAPVKIPYKITPYVLSNHKPYRKAIENDSTNPPTRIRVVGWLFQSALKSAIKNYSLIYTYKYSNYSLNIYRLIIL